MTNHMVDFADWVYMVHYWLTIAMAEVTRIDHRRGSGSQAMNTVSVLQTVGREARLVCSCGMSPIFLRL